MREFFYMYNPKVIKGTNHRDLESLHPLVAEKAKAFLAKAEPIATKRGLTVKIISTLRTWDEQTAIYAQGRTAPGIKVTNAKAGFSMHNWGLAFDIGVFENGKYVSNAKTEKLYDELGPIGVSVGLTWGGNFTSIKDRPHYEFTGKHSSQNAIKLLLAGKSVDEVLKG